MGHTFNVFVSKELDPFVNLAVENFLLRDYDNSSAILFLYSNRPSVIIGRFQNPWNELYLGRMEKQGIDLVRRQSGGGTVFHDSGNLNYSFIGPKDFFHKRENFSLIQNTLKDMGVPLILNERNDLLLNIKDSIFKVSGSAFKEIKNRSLHHGTLLISSELTGLWRILKEKESLESVGVKSKRSPVTNISEHFDVTIQKVESALIEKFREKYGKLSHYIFLSESNISHYYHLDYLKKLKSWDWTIGECPKFTCKIDDYEIASKGGRILSVKSVLDKKIINDFADLKIEDSTFRSVEKYGVPRSWLKKCEEFFFE